MKIAQSVDIHAPPEEVFALLKDVERRARLNPHAQSLSIRPLTEGPFGKGSRFRIRLRSGDRWITYDSEWIECEENRRIVARSITPGRELRVTLCVEAIPGGSRLTHEEEFLPVTEETHDRAWWRRLLRTVLLMELPGFPHFEVTEMSEAVKKQAEEYLKDWMEAIKTELEGSGG
ncbi:MAG: SRPBCC family protein [Nitrospirae bacterium]|nr:SRPBCC family protein [Nitrospirota bacterium]